VLFTRGQWPVVTLMLALAMIGKEWPLIWYGSDNTALALPLSLYCGILLTYWMALLPSAGEGMRRGAGSGGSLTTTGSPPPTVVGCADGPARSSEKSL
jgi:hypothetical protein